MSEPEQIAEITEYLLDGLVGACELDYDPLLIATAQAAVFGLLLNMGRQTGRFSTTEISLLVAGVVETAFDENAKVDEGIKELLQ